MTTLLKSCLVPWDVSPATAGLTLVHEQNDTPRCSVIFGGGRLRADGLIDSRRIQVDFHGTYWSRSAPHSEGETVTSAGYKIANGYDGDISQYLAWRSQKWGVSKFCPDAQFYVALNSDWIDDLKTAAPLRHYVIDSDAGYVEVLASSYTWREWMWETGHREAVVHEHNLVAEGSGAE